jgi:hypothetical protein
METPITLNVDLKTMLSVCKMIFIDILISNNFIKYKIDLLSTGLITD